MTQRYWGFLSYSHADEAASRRLHRALEHYTLPARVRKARGLPRRLTPVFRDVDDLAAASGLNAKLRQALGESRWLIVLCSPRAAQSKYVNDEIEYFQKAHGPGRILCALIDGEPEDSFGPALKALPDEPLAADLRPGRDYDLALLKLVAAMAGADFTELRDREVQRRRRRQLAAAVALAVAGISGVAWWDLFVREHIDHYRYYVREYGIWRGLDRIPDAIAAATGERYRFTRRGRLNPPERVDYVDGDDRCAGAGMRQILGDLFNDAGDQHFNTESRFCAVKFDYRQGGELERETWLSPLGRPLEALAYTQEGLAQFTQDGFSSSASRGGIQYVQFDRDGAGRDVQLRFLHSRGVPRPNDARHFGYRFAYDDVGRVEVRSVLDDSGAEIGERDAYVWGESGLMSENRLEDSQGKPRVGAEGLSRIRFVYDATGNEVERTAHDAQGDPVVAAGNFAVMRTRRDARGRRIEERYFDAAGRPVISRYGYAGMRQRYDAQGRVVRMEWFDAEDKPLMIAGGYAAAEVIWNERGLTGEERYYDTVGKLVEGGFVGAIVRNEYDAYGREIRECFFDGQGRPVMTRWGHCLERTLDERDRITEFRFIGADGKPAARLAASESTGRAAVNRVSFDANGNVLKLENFGVDGRRVRAGLCECALFEAKYDDFGNQVEQRRFDESGHLLNGGEGWAIRRREHDRSGNIVAERYFGPRDLPTRHAEGHYGFQAIYDTRGRVVEKRFLGPAGEARAAAGTAYATARYVYELAGEVAAETYLDAAGVEVGRIEHRRDAHGRPVERRYYGADGGLAPDPRMGCAVLQSEYTVSADPDVQRCLDARMQPGNRRDEGWAVRTVTYKFGRKVAEELLDARGRPVKRKA